MLNMYKKIPLDVNQHEKSVNNWIEYEKSDVNIEFNNKTERETSLLY